MINIILICRIQKYLTHSNISIAPENFDKIVCALQYSSILNWINTIITGLLAAVGIIFGGLLTLGVIYKDSGVFGTFFGIIFLIVGIVGLFYFLLYFGQVKGQSACHDAINELRARGNSNMGGRPPMQMQPVAYQQQQGRAGQYK